MSDDFDKKDKTAEGLVKSEAEASSGSDDEYEKICFLCRRPESVAGQMIDLPNHIHICTECRQKSFDTMNQGNLNYQDLMNHMPNISMIDLNSLQIRFQTVRKSKSARKKRNPRKFWISAAYRPRTRSRRLWTTMS